MGMESVPDTFGLTEYFITDVFTEVDGGNVRIICGTKRAGAIHWLYSCIMPAERLIAASGQCQSAAQEAFNFMQMIDRRVAH